jgi:hydroxyacylglutathione hydrolase
MRPIRADLWETRVDRPLPGLTTHSYLWTGGPNGNVLFYGTASDADFDEIEALGGVAHHYLSHHHEAGPMVAAVAARFGALLHAPALDSTDVAEYAPVGVTLATRHVDAQGIEVIPTPGHTPGSTCYLVPGGNGQSYLFTGDTLFLDAQGTLSAGFIPPISEAGPLSASLRVLAGLRPNLMISSAFGGEMAVHVVGADWPTSVSHAAARLRACA